MARTVLTFAGAAMILTCPACSARYEVARLALPDSGRDVVCVACGHAWFYLPNAADESAPMQPEPEGAPETPEAEAEAAPAPRAPSVAAAIPPEILSFLREEAARRTAADAAAAAEKSTPDPNTSLPEDNAMAPAPETSTNVDAQPEAKIDTEIVTRAQAVDAAPAEAIEPADASAATAPPEVLWRTAMPASDAGSARGGRGVLGLALALVLAGALYLAGPSLSTMLPALAPALAGYNAAVQAMIDWATAGLLGR